MVYPISLTNLNSFSSKPISMDKSSHLKEKIKEQYGKIALDGNSNSCCMPSSDCCGTPSEILLTPLESSKAVGYDSDKLNLIPESSVLGVGCKILLDLQI